MGIIRFAIKRPVTMTILISVIIILGFFTFSKLPLALYPDMKLPYAAVMTTYSGAGPEEVEQVTKTLEGQLNSLSGVKEIASYSTPGSSIILISFNWGTDMSNAINDIREKTSMVEKYLPDGVEKPMVFKMDVNLMPIVQMGIQAKGDTSMSQLQRIAEDEIKPRLERIPEVASVRITGGLTREIKVELDPVKLEANGLTLSQVTATLAAENFNMSSGQVKSGGREYFLRNLQEFQTVDDIRDVAITTSTGTTLRLGDIATVTDGYVDDTQITRLNGGAAVGIHCQKQSDANTVKACEAIKAEMEKVQKELGQDIEVSIVMDQSTYINQTLDSVKRTLVEGALLAMLILFLFLRNGRSTLIIFTAIPLSIITTFILMYFDNDTLNVITLGGLSLGVGRMVDDSIVVFENIYRHRSLGLSPIEAAITGASQVSNAVIASTMTILAVFLPVMFVTEGIASVIFKPMAVTVSFAILCSLLVSLTVVPLMASRMLTDKSMSRTETAKGRIGIVVERYGQWIDNLGEHYKNWLEWSLSHRKIVAGAVTLLMIVSLVLVPFIGAEFMPAMDSGEISISLEADKGNPLSDTNRMVNVIEKDLHQIPEVKTIFCSIGADNNMSLTSGTQSEKATIYVKLSSRTDRDRSVDVVAEEIRNKVADIPGAKIKVNVTDMTSGMGNSAAPVMIRVRGDDLVVLKQLSKQVEDIVRTIPGTREVSSTLRDGNPEIQVKIDRRRAAAYGLTPAQIASEVKTAVNGTVATRYKASGTEVDVRVRYQKSGHDTISYLENISVNTARGSVVRLSQVADFVIAPGPMQINRVDRQREAEVDAYLLNRDLNSVMKDIQDRVGAMNLPAGYSVQYGGQNEEMIESFMSLTTALLLAIILVYAVMAILYESFFLPFIIMFSVPTAFIGVVLSLFITGNSFSVNSFIGVIMLIGIVVANAIVLVDYLQQLRHGGMERNAAIVEAGRVRLRPILMTAFATILAMAPMSLGLGEGGEAEAPLAIVIIGGLLVSTAITLVLVPVVYSIFDDWSQKLKQRKAAKDAPTAEIAVE